MYAQWSEAMPGRGRLDEAEEYGRRSLEAAEGEGADPRGRAAALEWLGITERRRGNAEVSDAYLDASVPFLDRARRRPLALHHMHKGDTALVRGDGGAALEHYRTARSLLREHATEHPRDDANEGKLLVSEARMLTDAAPRRARALLEEALTRFLAANRASQVGKVLEALGDLAADGEGPGGPVVGAGIAGDGGSAADGERVGNAGLAGDGGGAGYWTTAVEVFALVGDRGAADRVRGKLAAGTGTGAGTGPGTGIGAGTGTGVKAGNDAGRRRRD